MANQANKNINTQLSYLLHHYELKKFNENPGIKNIT